ncbi:tripartite tricarboxylate transporter TctB family protein [Roseiarcaceae bacterium H3SJ34-1]|uniref:tripartite tricarboxylate transporter TctB family protein n=1 Tax=Terripilifer ovatus TaxID=3032367 RepID=UPI003AB98175|nr:tripartite tricarboxylate transporter TctB family protein [Roseiarcaceae bacterium H3SJ34-1]
MLKIKAGKDFWSGIMFLCFAIVELYIARGYSMGSSGEMGPGYFPVVLGIVLGALGALLVARAIIAGDEPVAGASIRPLLLLVASVVVFGVTIEPLGLVLSLVLTVAIAALAGRQSGPLEIALLAAALAVLSVGIFHFALLLPLPIWPAL